MEEGNRVAQVVAKVDPLPSDTWSIHGLVMGIPNRLSRRMPLQTEGTKDSPQTADAADDLEESHVDC